MKKRLARWLLLLLALSPALLPLWLILTHGVDTPYWDQFDDDLAGMYLKADSGQLTFADLAAQHNEHRLLVPRLCYRVLNSLTHWNVIVEMLAGWVAAVATSIVLFRIAGSSGPDRETARTNDSVSHRPRVFWWFLANLLIFSPAQWENWLWGMGLANLLPMLWTSLALAAASSTWHGYLKASLVILFCTLATYSSGNGMLSWGLAGGVLLWAPTKRELRSRRPVALLLLVAVTVVVAVYAIGLVPPNHRGLTPYDSDLVTKLHYTMVFAGNPLASGLNLPPTILATGIGTTLYALLTVCGLGFIVLWRRGEQSALCRQLLPWFGVAGFAVASGILAAYTRAGVGPAQALSSRYVSFSLYLPVALIQLVPPLWSEFHARVPRRPGEPARVPPALSAILATILILLAFGSIPAAVENSSHCTRARQQSRAVATLVNILPGHPLIAATVFPDPAVAQRIVTGLDRIGYLRPRLFTSTKPLDRVAPNAPPPESCGQLEQAWESSPGVISFTGWAVLPSQRRSADLVVLCAQDEQSAAVIVDMTLVNVPRPDKIAPPKDRDLVNCGWVIRVLAANLELLRGPKTITAWAMDSETGLLVPLAGSAHLGP